MEKESSERDRAHRQGFPHGHRSVGRGHVDRIGAFLRYLVRVPAARKEPENTYGDFLDTGAAELRPQEREREREREVGRIWRRKI
ncbi:hypothetical protein COCNU_contig68760514G000010 [Cocos nucifera]|nr:hypothetical protein [Cocos nucifera]